VATLGIQAAVSPVVPLSSLDRSLSVGDLVSFSGYRGRVCGYTPAGLVRVSFGASRFKEIPEADLSVFVPWWSDRD